MIVLYRIVCNTTCNLIITINWIGSLHNASHIPSATPLNSASALEQATTFCFWLLHVIRFPRTKGKYPKLDRLSSIALAQPTSVCTFITKLFVNFVSKLQIFQNAHNCIHMLLSKIMHKLTYNTYRISKVWSCVC